MPLEATLDDLKPRPPDSAGLDCFFRYAWIRQYFAAAGARIAAGARATL
jgi:hypothetical protein